MRHRTGRRVLIVVQNMPVPLDRRVWMECRSLVAAGYTVSVICPKGPGDPSYEVLEGVHLFKYRPSPQAAGVIGYAREFLASWLKAALLSFRVARKPGFDVLQACNPPDTYFALGLIHRLFGRRFVYDQHDLCPEVFEARFGGRTGLLHRLLLLLERCTYAAADHVIVTNGSYRSIALERGRLQPEDVTIVRSGPDSHRMHRHEPDLSAREGAEHLVCYLGIMGPQDGVDVLVRAVDVLVHERGRTDTRVAVLGYGDCFDELVALTDRLGLSPWITFTGRADDRMIDRYLSAADIGISPDPPTAFNEASTMNKVLEYMAYSLPVVSFDLRETRVSAGAAAAYARGAEPGDLAACVDELLADPGRRQAMGAFGRRRLERSLGWEHQAARYVHVYDDLFAPDGVVEVPVPEPVLAGATTSG